MNATEFTDPVPQPIVSAGKILSEKRHEWDMSIQEVASSLNLGVDSIEALEADDYDKLPGTTFVKGYIRSYAKLLKLDVEGLMDSIDLQPERITEIPSSRAALKRKGKIRTRERSSGGGVFKWVILLVVIGGLGAFGLTQLPRLGINSISELFDFTGTQAEQPETNQLIIPAPKSSEQPKGALIRIE